MQMPQSVKNEALKRFGERHGLIQRGRIIGLSEK
jgi:hypothetical protein